MKENFEIGLGYVLGHEGGFFDHWNDAGGETNHGIIQSIYDGYRRRKGLIPRSVKQITMGEVVEIYKAQYWDAVRADELPPGIDYCVFDAAVNSGPKRGVRWLQQGVNDVAKKSRLRVDEVIGLATLDASDDYDPEALIDAMIDRRLGFMKIARNRNTGVPLWPTFGKGWMNRLFGYLPAGKKVRNADGVDDHAKAMARNAAPAAKKYPLPQLPVPTTQPQPQQELPGWIVPLLMALAAAFGVWQWQS